MGALDAAQALPGSCNSNTRCKLQFASSSLIVGCCVYQEGVPITSKMASSSFCRAEMPSG
eukprot:scaffold853_cov386-Prasinococcus_capsulatus_cf.AAC.21